MARLVRVVWLVGMVLIGSAWAYSYAVPLSDWMRLREPGTRVVVSRGQCKAFVWRPKGRWLAYYLYPTGSVRPSLADDCRWHAGGFGAEVGDVGRGLRVRAVVPFWFLAAAWAVPAVAVHLRAQRATGRRSDARCAQCGYDLRVTPACCPECGTTPA